MKKIVLLLVLIGLSIAIGYSLRPGADNQVPKTVFEAGQLREILRFAIVSDSSGEDDLLAKALEQAKGTQVNFIIGLGDWTQVGTVEDLASAKKVFDASGFDYFVTVGDHDVWDSRNRGMEPTVNFVNVFGNTNHLIEKNGVQIVIVNNSDIYKGIDTDTWEFLTNSLNTDFSLTFVMAHKTPFHPDSAHVMGSENKEVAAQAKSFLDLIKAKEIDGFFSGDLHFFARFNDPDNVLKITTVGAVASERNFQGPRFAVVKVFSDYSWEVEDVEIR